MNIDLPVKYDTLNSKTRKLVREKYIEIQNNKCWYCSRNLDEQAPEKILKYKINLKWFPEGFLDNPIHLQHDHNTGLTEGAVHAYCNAVLWEYFNR